MKKSTKKKIRKTAKATAEILVPVVIAAATKGKVAP